MRTEDLILVSVDDHVVEPPTMFDAHVPDRFRDSAPRVVTRDDGVDVWTYADTVIPNFGLNAVAGRPPEEYGFEPTRFAEVRPGTYDINERVRDMNANGVLGSMCFPSFPQFCGQTFMKNPDWEQALAHLKAYNDWHVDEWCGTHPGRFIPLGLVPLWDPAAAASEVHRLAAKGCHAITFSENPAKLGLPSFHSEHWDPLWQAAVDEGTIICLHIGSSSQLVVTAADAPIDCMITLQPMNIVQAAADLLWSPVTSCSFHHHAVWLPMRGIVGSRRELAGTLATSLEFCSSLLVDRNSVDLCQPAMSLLISAYGGDVAEPVCAGDGSDAARAHRPR